MPVERRQQYLNICRSNVVRVFPSTSEHADDVAVFNANQAATLERGTFVLEDPAGEATTSADLVAMTQRHVIHQSHAQRAPPSTASKGKHKWAWKSFVPKTKKKPTQHLQEDHESNPQPSPSTSESPRSPPVPAPAKQPRRMPTLAPPANQAISMPSTASHFSIPPVHPSSLPIESRSSTSKMTPDALSLAVDQVLNDDDW
ncbi:hypothetical protein H257_03857 [Aphanomyces astaci]|uniref:Uncharacterized protein n=1 Tax=Aphanomyces astaci TaxID=112090 RepID=W4GYL4_APHAT|nr:hypothetical protein H257_03857 [Aphanomyces astaci]ETV84757.1 hypothetical protein H257_03857 [Aphanomyces astaci]|eukprot:XP_009826449.1 hypothetical protein H257_03857 [Aphanomyces astaci]